MSEISNKHVEASRENGKLGGRPKSAATLLTQKIRDYVAQRLEKDAPELYDILMEKARKGDVAAIKELFDRGMGKATTVVTNEDGELISAVALKFIECGHNTRSTTTSETTDLV